MVGKYHVSRCRWILFGGALCVFTGTVLAALCPIDPVPFELPQPGPLMWNDLLSPSVVEHIGVDDLIGPESLVPSLHDPNILFIGLQDGRIVRVTRKDANDTLTWDTVIRTGTEPPLPDVCGRGGPGDVNQTEHLCGRPLGMRVSTRRRVLGENDDDEVLLVADPYKGLLCIVNLHGTDGQAPRIIVLATKAITDPESSTFMLVNDLVQLADGNIYFTETTTAFQRRRILYALLDGRPSGRLLKYSPQNKVASVVADHLFMPNGIELSIDGHALLIVSGVQVLRYDLHTQTMDLLPFVNVLPGSGDNVRLVEATNAAALPKQCVGADNMTTCYVFGLGSKYAQPFALVYAIRAWPSVRMLMASLLPYEWILSLIPRFGGVAFVAQNGTLVETWQDRSGHTPWMSEAVVWGNYMYIGSWFNPFLARVRVSV